MQWHVEFKLNISLSLMQVYVIYVIVIELHNREIGPSAQLVHDVYLS